MITADTPLLPVHKTESLISIKMQKVLLVALTVIFTVGMIVSYALNAPWFVPLTFFALALLPLIKLGRINDRQDNKLL
jgi:hypothetical protein